MTDTPPPIGTPAWRHRVQTRLTAHYQQQADTTTPDRFNDALERQLLDIELDNNPND